MPVVCALTASTCVAVECVRVHTASYLETVVHGDTQLVHGGAALLILPLLDVQHVDLACHVLEP
jgi:hypothetical protein